MSYAGLGVTRILGRHEMTLGTVSRECHEGIMRTKRVTRILGGQERHWITASRELPRKLHAVSKGETGHDRETDVRGR